MKVLMINVMCGLRSTGRICSDIACELDKQGHEVIVAYGRGSVPDNCQQYAHRIDTDFEIKCHGLKARLFDRCGFGSTIATTRFVKWIKEYDPDVIHLHNLHGYYLNVRVLFDYLKNCNKRIIWTLHDCWPFTGHCGYFDYVQCKKWKTECNHCVNGKEYPARLLIDASKRNYIEKKELFTGIPNMTIVTPSYWLAKELKESFLQDYPVRVIPNGVDTSVFKPTASKLRLKLNLEDKRIILGVAAVWHKRKGLEDFLMLAKLVSSDYRIILIGLNDNQIRMLPPGIIGIKRTDSAQELAEYYSVADVYVNPTYEDNYPTTNIEAIACGTPVITYETGGSGESARMYGKAIEKGRIDEVYKCIENGSSFQMKHVRISAKATVDDYMTLYEERA